ncbi:hypothetical protein SD81_002580 [Tolypothrix campylonemoides VB511288]|nr:hypothetical protein SD81_002570 [Tolypothrix campylonemoides VB511288]KAB8320498.1 hypothetical protein SD81_002575 [Tolypothrix campylonemoides VB511288]KAB8320499.1 hypothetical protein SD81_002580 [Tolypothrix campylonemoides VB511288]
MQDELKNVISQAMNTSSNSEQELVEQIAEGELSDEVLEAVAGGKGCRQNSHVYDYVECTWASFSWKKDGLGVARGK